MPLAQHKVFAGGEGDRWFERNRAGLDAFDAAEDRSLRLVELYGLRPKRVLEVGAASGARLAAFAERYGARTVGIDVSQEALAHGRNRYAGVELIAAPAHEIPLNDPFDLVIVHFVLHWIDRPLLLQVVSELDRLTADHGHMIVGDFAPSNFVCAPYHHRSDADVRTYKQDYAAVFLASGLYHRVGMLSANHHGQKLASPVGEIDRVSVWLLCKNTQGHYVSSDWAGVASDGRTGKP